MTVDTTTEEVAGASRTTLSLTVQYALNGTEDLGQLESALRRVAERAIEEGGLEGYGSESIEDYRIDAEVFHDESNEGEAVGKLLFQVFHSLSDQSEVAAIERAMTDLVDRALDQNDLVGFESESIADYSYDVDLDSEQPATRPRFGGC